MHPPLPPSYTHTRTHAHTHAHNTAGKLGHRGPGTAPTSSSRGTRRVSAPPLPEINRGARTYRAWKVTRRFVRALYKMRYPHATQRHVCSFLSCCRNPQSPQMYSSPELSAESSKPVEKAPAAAPPAAGCAESAKAASENPPLIITPRCVAATDFLLFLAKKCV